MTNHSNQHHHFAFTRFHTQRENGCYVPVAYLFVTEQMCSAIEHERAAILDALPATLRDEQAVVFARYDPRRQAEAFQRLLGLFNAERAPAMRHAL